MRTGLLLVDTIMRALSVCLIILGGWIILDELINYKGQESRKMISWALMVMIFVLYTLID